MVGHEVDDDLQASLVRPLHKLLEFADARLRVFRQVGINVVVVANGIRAACLALHHIGVVLGNAVGGVVGLAGMLNDACEPNMGTAKSPNLIQSLGCKVLHGAASVLLLGAEGDAVSVVCTEKAGKDLIDGH